MFEPKAINSSFLSRVLIIGSLLTIVFLFSNRLFGIIGLEAIYANYAVIIFLVLFGILLGFLTYRLSIPIGLSILVFLFFVLISPYIMDIGYFILIPVYCAFGTALLCVPIVFALLLSQKFRERCFQSTIITTLMLFAILICVFGIGNLHSRATYQFAKSMFWNNHIYHITIWIGWLGDPHTLSLYECNSLGLNCQVVYTAPSSYYAHEPIQLVSDTGPNNLSVIIDDKVLYTYQPE